MYVKSSDETFWKITASHALDPDSEFNSIYLTDNVKFEKKNLSEEREVFITTSRAIVYPAEEKVETDAFAIIITPDSKTTGDGVIADFKMTDGMLQGFIRKINLNRLARPRMVICVPSGVTEVERRAVKDSGERANAREVYLIEEPVAAAIGIGLDISQPVGNIIVDIGGGTSEIAVISLNGVVTKETIRIAGDEMDEAVLQWFRNEHKLEIGLSMSEKIKISVGSAMKMKSADIAVKGRDLVSGIPKTIEVSSDEIRQALKDPVNQIVEAVKRCLEQTPPELAADILERGIILAGGGSLLKGVDQIIRERTNVPVNVSEDPLLSVVRGTGMVMENLKKYQAVLL